MYAVTVGTPRPEHGRRTHLVIFETSRPVGARHKSFTQLVWKTRDPGGHVTPIYIFTFGNSRPIRARNTSCTQLLQKPRQPSRKGTFQPSRLVGARHNSCTQLLWNHYDPGRQATPTSAVTAESSRCGQAWLAHLRSYRANLKYVYACVL
jgi:hypothetical protein